jgi:hypothetical protein
MASVLASVLSSKRKLVKGMTMWTSSHLLAEDPCPVDEELLAALYKAKRPATAEIVATVGPALRAPLALFCYRRSHLHELGVIIAAGCDRDDLAIAGGALGEALFARSRETIAPVTKRLDRPKITLPSGPLRTFAQDDELDDEQL